MATRGTQPDPAALRRHRLTQIRKAYTSRLRVPMSKRALEALNAERARQISLANAEYLRGIKRIERAAAKKAPAKKAPRKKVSHAKTVSRFWKHFAKDGTPIPPWDVSVGPGMDVEDQTTDVDWDVFAEEDYTYEDFDTDWGDYEFDDTGYPDENT